MSEEFFDYEHQEPKTSLIAFLLVSSCIFVVAVCAFLAWMFSVTKDAEVGRKLNQATYSDLQELHKSEDSKLGSYQYIDKEKGIVRIPVERAMQLMVEEAKNKPVASPAISASPAAKPEAKPAEVKPASTPQPAKPTGDQKK